MTTKTVIWILLKLAFLLASSYSPLTFSNGALPPCPVIADVNECDPNPCQNSGVCTDGEDSFSCACATGYDGATCSSELVAVFVLVFSHAIALGSQFYLSV
jgi:hypothetical protein